jgi:hypothetical protein
VASLKSSKTKAIALKKTGLSRPVVSLESLKGGSNFVWVLIMKYLLVVF